MPTPGQVLGFYSKIAGKYKYHLCVHINGVCLFLNTPRGKTFPGDLVVPCSDIPCLTPTDSGQTVVACNLLVKLSASELQKATVHGDASRDLLVKIMDHIENADYLSDEDRELILEGLDGYL